ncbi:protein kinase domain-containing protein [Ditylenchus destructor]|uniref:Serine/threonine-protein kinase greatwall n=1 Tax=Ditylenchus destructor TaxID=166010 RepID=A0AAD4MLX5_9BILA|nr:protein kinase domain-containing protein [Ditylenchus destructor]
MKTPPNNYINALCCVLLAAAVGAQQLDGTENRPISLGNEVNAIGQLSVQENLFSETGGRAREPRVPAAIRDSSLDSVSEFISGFSPRSTPMVLLVHSAQHSNGQTRTGLVENAPAQPRARQAQAAPRNALQQGVKQVQLVGQPNQVVGQLRSDPARTPEKRTLGNKTLAPTPDDFELTSTVFGEGAFGKVIKVVHKVTRKEYAMKIMKDVTEIREIVIGRYLKSRSRCPYLMNFVAFDSSDWRASVEDRVVPHINAKGEKEIRIVMEIMDIDLLKLLEIFTSFSENLARVLMFQLLLGLRHLHRIGIIHRDVKAENILLKFRSARMWLTDFGISTIAKESSSFAGTATYMAPEVIAQEKYGPEVDFWSAGVLLYEMVAGQDPFEGISSFDKVLEKTLNVKKKLAKFGFPKHVKISDECKAVITRLMEPDPSKRVGTNGGADEILRMEFFRKIDPELMERVKDENDLMIDFMVEELNESVKKAKLDRVMFRTMSARKSDASRHPMQDITSRQPQNPVTPQAKPQLVTPVQKKPAPNPVNPTRGQPANNQFVQEQEIARKKWDEAAQRAQAQAIQEARRRHAMHRQAQEEARIYAAAIRAAQTEFWWRQNISPGFVPNLPPGFVPNPHSGPVPNRPPQRVRYVNNINNYG